MKKLISLFLALTMVLGMATTAFAAETTDTNKATANEESSNKADIEVTGKYLSQLNSDEIISVDVAWEDMHFIYYATQQGTWKPETHTYDGDKTAKWNKTTSDITVTNHSNVEITADLSYTASVSTVTGTLSATTIELANAAEGDSLGDTTKAPSGTSTFTIDGYMESSDSALGTITVALKENEGGEDDEDGEDGDDNDGTMSEADFRSAMASGGTVTLSNDITLTSALTIDNTVTLDLNGYSISLQDGSKISVTGNLTVNDSRETGGISGSTILGEIITCTGTMTVNGGVFTNNGFGQVSTICLVAKDATNMLTINGGTFEQNVELATSGLSNPDPQIKITNGTIEGLNIALPSGDATVLIQGGTFNTPFSISTNSNDQVVDIDIEGGTFIFNPSDYIDTDSYQVVNNGCDYTVSKK